MLCEKKPTTVTFSDEPSVISGRSFEKLCFSKNNLLI